MASGAYRNSIENIPIRIKKDIVADKKEKFLNSFPPIFYL